MTNVPPLVLLPWNIAQALETLRNKHGWSNIPLIRMSLAEELEPCLPFEEEAVKVLHSYPHKEHLLRAIIEGYTVEKTFREEIVELVALYQGSGDAFDRAALLSIKDVLRLLGRHDPNYAAYAAWAADNFGIYLTGDPADTTKKALNPDDFKLIYDDDGNIGVIHLAERKHTYVCTVPGPPTTMLAPNWREKFWEDERAVSMIREYAEEAGLEL